MFEGISNIFKKIFKAEAKKESNSGKEAKERLHLVLMQDRANVSADFLEMMKQEIIEVIKKYIDVDENAIDVRLTNQSNDDGTNGAPALYANIPIISIKEDNTNNDVEVVNDIEEENKKEHIQKENIEIEEKEEDIEEEINESEEFDIKEDEDTVENSIDEEENINEEENLDNKSDEDSKE